MILPRGGAHVTGMSRASDPDRIGGVTQDMGDPLTPVQAARVYDRIAGLQDRQGFYEAAAIDELIEHSAFASARSVYELGPGTGALAARLLENELPPDATYRGIDVSPVMVDLARGRIHRWAERARVDLHDGSVPLPGDDASYDRFLSAYVFDLLSDDYVSGVLAEANRLLHTDGLLCLVSLGTGGSSASRLVAGLWRRVWDVAPRVVGGCRPVDLASVVAGAGWDITHASRMESWGIPSDVVVAAPPGRF